MDVIFFLRKGRMLSQFLFYIIKKRNGGGGRRISKKFYFFFLSIKVAVAGIKKLYFLLLVDLLFYNRTLSKIPLLHLIIRKNVNLMSERQQPTVSNHLQIPIFASKCKQQIITHQLSSGQKPFFRNVLLTGIFKGNLYINCSSIQERRSLQRFFN